MRNLLKHFCPWLWLAMLMAVVMLTLPGCGLNVPIVGGGQRDSDTYSGPKGTGTAYGLRYICYSNSPSVGGRRQLMCGLYSNASLGVFYSGSVSGWTASLELSNQTVLAPNEIKEATVESPYNFRFDVSDTDVVKVMEIHLIQSDYPTETWTTHEILFVSGSRQYAMTLLPSDDTYVWETNAGTNYNSAGLLKATLTTCWPALNCAKKSFMKFNVTGLGARTVVSAKLYLYVQDGSAGSGGEFSYCGTGVLDTTGALWSETTLTWLTAPASCSAVPFSTLGAVNGSTWQEIDMTTAISVDGDHTIRISSQSEDAVQYYSKEQSAFSPYLRLILVE